MRYEEILPELLFCVRASEQQQYSLLMAQGAGERLDIRGIPAANARWRRQNEDAREESVLDALAALGVRRCELEGGDAFATARVQIEKHGGYANFANRDREPCARRLAEARNREQEAPEVG